MSVTRIEYDVALRWVVQSRSVPAPIVIHVSTGCADKGAANNRHPATISIACAGRFGFALSTFNPLRNICRPLLYQLAVRNVGLLRLPSFSPTAVELVK